MQNKHPFRTVLLTGLAAALFCGTPLTAPVTALALPTPTTTVVSNQEAQPICVYGNITAITQGKNGSRLLLENSNDKDPYQKIDVLVSGKTVLLDAVSGNTKTLQDLKENTTIYAYVGPAIAASMPPQASATLILCNIPADFGVPKYAEVQTITAQNDGITLQMNPSVILHLNKKTELLSYTTDNILNLEDITVGSHLLSWYAVETASMPGQATPTKVMVFPKEADPQELISRGDFMTMLYATAKSPDVEAATPFTDTDAPAIRWAAAQKIATGTGNAAFCPGDPLTREQMMVFLLRYATALEKGPVGAWSVAITYEDRADLAPWATAGAMWNEITKLVPADANHNILPTAPVTHGEAAAAIEKLLAR